MPRKTDNDVSWSSADAVSWQLSLDLQEAVEMLSAIRLQVLKKNPLRDTVVVAGPPGSLSDFEQNGDLYYLYST